MAAGLHEDPAGGGGRIGKLARIRNRALEPLWLSAEVSDIALLSLTAAQKPFLQWLCYVAMLPCILHWLAQMQRFDGGAAAAGAAGRGRQKGGVGGQ